MNSASASSQPQPAPTQTTNREPLRRGTITRYAVGSLGTGGFATLPGLVLIYYMTDSLGITALAAGLVMTLAKVWDVLIDPVIGGLSDSALALKGTRRGPMLLGAIGLPLAFILTFSVPSGLSPWISAIWVLIAFLTAATFFSLFQVPYIALPAELTDSYSERTRLLTWRVVMLTVAILLFGAGGPELRALFPDNPNLGYLTMAVVAAVVLAVALLISSRVAPRQPAFAPSNLPPKAFSLQHYRESIAVIKESQPFRALLGTFMLQALATGLMLAGAQYVATWVLRDESAVTVLFASLIAPALLFAPVWQKIADRLGKERGFTIASVLFTIASLALVAMIWAPGWWIVVPVGIAGAAYAGMQSLPMSMLPDVIAHDGGTRAGRFGGTWTAGETTGMAFGATLLTIVLTLTGYVESTAGVAVEQPASAVAGIAIAFSLVPALLMLLSFITLKRYKLREADFASISETTK